MIKIIKNLAIALLILLTMTSGNFPLHNAGEIKWLTFEQMLQQSQSNRRKVVIDVYTDWCGWCKRMDATTFRDKNVVDYVNKKYYAVKLDAESSKIFKMGDKEISERQLAGEIFKVTGYPTTVYLDENLNVLTPVSGYLDVPMFHKILKYYGDDFYKKQSWQEFETSYKP
ncbi:MAG: DUF255 domain-containing protein [Cytophagales bacterium]|nr:DUF255 domain-containing protein [Cytophagales bacterium]